MLARSVPRLRAGAAKTQKNGNPAHKSTPKVSSERFQCMFPHVFLRGDYMFSIILCFL